MFALKSAPKSRPTPPGVIPERSVPVCTSAGKRFFQISGRDAEPKNLSALLPNQHIQQNRECRTFLYWQLMQNEHLRKKGEGGGPREGLRFARFQGRRRMFG